MHPRCGQMKTHLIGEIIISFISLKTGIPVQTSSSKSQEQKNLHTQAGDHGVVEEWGPNITASSVTEKYNTGYALRKGLNPDGKYTNNTQSIVGSIIFRTAEAYLNYIEAYYELHGSLDSYAEKYWKAIRRRAGIDEDYTKTIRLTDMSKEAETDWGHIPAEKLLMPHVIISAVNEDVS